MPADGVVVDIGGEHRVLRGGPVAGRRGRRRRVGARTRATRSRSTDSSVPRAARSSTSIRRLAAGALALNLPDGQYAVWFRGEALRSVDWGGDPHNKAIAVSEGDEVRLSPRKSFDRWREIVRPTQRAVDADRDRVRRGVAAPPASSRCTAARAARSAWPRRCSAACCPTSIPTLDGWQLSAHYEPAAGGRVGGDWYDAFELRDGRLVVLIGDVAGHGITAAGTMAQLRNALRAYLFAGAAPAEALNQLNDFCVHMLPRAFATVIVARVDLGLRGTSKPRAPVT